MAAITIAVKLIRLTCNATMPVITETSAAYAGPEACLDPLRPNCRYNGKRTLTIIAAGFVKEKVRRMFERPHRTT